MAVKLQSEILEVILPHGPDFRLISRLIDVTSEVAIGEFDYVGNEELKLQDHFPGQPVMPGVLLPEAMAQTAIQLAQKNPALQGKLFALVGIDKCRFHHAIRPGSRVTFEVKLESYRHGLGTATCIAYTGPIKVASATITFAEF